MRRFEPAAACDLSSCYGEAASSGSGSQSYLDQGSALLEQYAPALKTLLFDEDPRIEYAKKKKELDNYVASYKLATNNFTRNAYAKNIQTLQAELAGLQLQIDEQDTAERTKQFGKVAGIAFVVSGIVGVLLVGNYFIAKTRVESEKAETERWRRRHENGNRSGAST